MCEACKVVVFDFDSTLSSPIYVASRRVWAIADKPEVLASLSAAEKIENFGGAERLASLDALLQTLRDRGVDLFIISIGFKRAIVPLLEAVALVRHFDVAKIYGQDSPELASRHYVKADLIAHLATKKQWTTPKDVLFVDDSAEHIAAAQAINIARTLKVRGHRGILKRDIDIILDRVSER